MHMSLQTSKTSVKCWDGSAKKGCNKNISWPFEVLEEDGEIGVRF